ncbi:unnamed protein product [Rotaria sp. Silwood1]|nr:unnamed protein product [Rotaria sp. Silwood1]CAF4811847.1 unnamed protein product [Rotaria sp. Silwood1]
MTDSYIKQLVCRFEDTILTECGQNKDESTKVNDQHIGINATELLKPKINKIEKDLLEIYFKSEVDHALELLEFNIVVIGSPRVGKSELINTLCGGKKLAETSTSLTSCTKEIKKYVLEGDQTQASEITPSQVNFYDTPGLESWIDEGGQKCMFELIEKTNPICIIYCASPGSFADLLQLRPVLQNCNDRNIFCALVCTNMWSSNRRQKVIEEFQNELSIFGTQNDMYSDQFNSKIQHKISFFGNGTLCTMSTLINALCGKEVAKTSNSLKSCTDKLEKYVHKGEQPANDGVSPPIQYSITFWDTPGIESWSENDVRQHFTNIMHESNPICMIYCASPGSFLLLEQLKWLVDTCIQSKIFCALVCTNKYSGGSQKRAQVMEDFQSLFNERYVMIKDESNVKYFTDVALCTAVNSIVYEDQELDIRKDIEGINELIFGMMTSLKDNKLVGWCYTVAENDTFWTTMKESSYRTIFWDTPGIESWHELDVRRHITSLIEHTHPICMIYCASPGSFAKLEQVKWLLLECHRQNIFSAVVCTNMWAGRNRRELVNELCEIIQSVHPTIEPREEDGVIYFDRVTLCMMVNSETYIDEEFDLTKSPSGINELIFDSVTESQLKLSLASLGATSTQTTESIDQYQTRIIVKCVI